MNENRQNALMNLETIVAIARVLQNELSKDDDRSNASVCYLLKQIVEIRETLQSLAKRYDFI